jgi:hypothetical protein
MAKLTLADESSGFQTTAQRNANYAAIETALENTLSRDGTSPNAMGVDLDMNSHKVINLAAPTANSDAARWVDVASAVGLNTAVPNQAGNGGRVLTTTGSALVWQNAQVVVTNIAEMQALTGLVDGAYVYCAGYYVKGDLGAGLFYYSSASAATVDGGIVIDPTTLAGRFIRSTPSILTPQMWGVTGDGATDDASKFNIALQAAAGKSLHIPKQTGSFYLVGDNLLIPSNTTVSCESGVVIKTVASSFGSGDAIFYMNEVDNITIQGNGAILQGLREGTGTSIISMGVKIAGSTNIRIYDIKCIDASGDGFIIQAADDNSPAFSKDIWLENCVAQNCMRQGLSIISAQDLWVKNCRFSDTNGKAPAAGIDIEPESISSLYGINIIHTITDNNSGGGFMVDLNTIPNNVDIVFDHCQAVAGAGADATGFEISNIRTGIATGDRIALNNCVAENTGSYGLLFRNINQTFDGVCVNNFQAINTNIEQISTYGNTPVAFYTVSGANFPNPGNIKIKGLKIFDKTASRTPYYINSDSAAWNNIVIDDLDWTNTISEAVVPYMDDGTTNTNITWWPTPFRLTRTSNTTLSARWSGWIFDNKGDTNTMIITLPPVAAGLTFSFEVHAAQLIQIDPNAADRLRPFASGDGKYMESNTVGSSATISANSDGTDWVVQRFGTWSDEP